MRIVQSLLESLFPAGELMGSPKEALEGCSQRLELVIVVRENGSRRHVVWRHEIISDVWRASLR